MVAGLLITSVFGFVFWLVFFRLKLIRLTPGWGILSALFGAHLLLIFVVGLRFVAPASVDAKIVQYTVQLVPRLPEPTLVTAVLVEEGATVKKGDALFQFDRTIYEGKVRQLEAQLAAAVQNIKVLEANVAVALGKQTRLKAELTYAQYRKSAADTLFRQGVGTELEADKWNADALNVAAGLDEAEAELRRAVVELESQIGGTNTAVAQVQAELTQARYYLDNTTMVAPADGRIVNLQVRPGMVAGIFRIGGIAAFIVDADRYLLATYYQQHLKYVRPGLPVEYALDAYPGQIFAATVDSIWRTNAEGQYLPSDVLPAFNARDPQQALGQFAVKIRPADKDAMAFSIGMHGVAAIYTGGGGFAALRKITIRAHSWLNWLYPLNV